MKNIRKIAFITNRNITNMYSWSVTCDFIPRSLEKQGYEIAIIDDLLTRISLLERINIFWYSHFSKKKFYVERQPSVIKDYAFQLSEKLKKIDYDLIFSISSLPIAFLDSDKPVVFWTDACFAGIIDYYPEFTNLSARTIRNGNFVEQSALDKCKLAIYTSEWAADSALKSYKVNPSKVKIVMQGANLDYERSEPEIDKIIEKKSFDKCVLLFAGLDWVRKGGDIAVEITRSLNEAGINAELNVLGTTPEFKDGVPDFVKIHGFVSKSTPEGRNLIEKLYEDAHFFVMPSRAEAVAMVYSIANSYGIPDIATKTGGTNAVITDDVNGKIFDFDADVTEYSDYIKSVFTNKDIYRKLAKNSYLEFKKRLNWDAAGKSLKNLFDEL